MMAVSRRFYQGNLFFLQISTIHHPSKEGFVSKTVDGYAFFAALFLEGLALVSIYADDELRPFV